MDKKVTLHPFLLMSHVLTGIQSGQQDTSGRTRPYSEHVRRTDHSPARTQWCWEDHNIVYANRLDA